jgi:hypothetical protein
MARRYDDPVDVRREDERPGQFLWRGRLYVVRGILAHWVEAGRWWAAPAARAVYAADVTGGVARTQPGAGRDPGPESGGPESGGPESGGPESGGPESGTASGPESGAVPVPEPGPEPGAAGIDDGEREVWRVEAAAGRGGGIGVYDLCFDWSAGRWTLLRALD